MKERGCTICNYDTSRTTSNIQTNKGSVWLKGDDGGVVSLCRLSAMPREEGGRERKTRVKKGVKKGGISVPVRSKFLAPNTPALFWKK